jgi:hypothetical protein
LVREPTTFEGAGQDLEQAWVAGVERESDVLIGQLIAVANQSFKREIGVLPATLLRELERRVRIVLEL